MTELEMLKCPGCGSSKVYANGHRCLKNGLVVQRYICGACDYRFSDSTKGLKAEWLDNTNSQQNNPCKELELLAALEQKRASAGEKLKGIPQEAKGYIVKYIAYLEREGYYGESSYIGLLARIAKVGTVLTDPDNVKTVIARQPWKNSVKMLASYAYDAFCKMEKIPWEPPHYKQEETILDIPDEKDLDQLISASQSRRMTAFLQTLKETFADPSEILKVEWRDLKGNILNINHPCKGHLPGQYELTPRLLAMINCLPQKDKRIFPTTYESMNNSLIHLRKAAARNLQNPKLLSISFKSFRHWGGSMLAHYTNGNVLTIKKMLRHKRVENTMKYIHTLTFKDDDYETATASTPEEIKELGKAGFIKYDELNGLHFYRKPKRFGSCRV
jgi:integrase